MFNTVLRIYILTNALFLLSFPIMFFPEGILFSFFAAIFSLTFSFPLIFLLLAVIFLLKQFCPWPIASWILFLASVGCMTYLPLYWIDISLFGEGEDKFFSSMAYVSAFLSILILRKHIHKFFVPDKNEQKEKDQESFPIEPVQPLQTNNYN